MHALSGKVTRTHTHIDTHTNSTQEIEPYGECIDFHFDMETGPRSNAIDVIVCFSQRMLGNIVMSMYKEKRLI